MGDVGSDEDEDSGPEKDRDGGVRDLQPARLMGLSPTNSASRRRQGTERTVQRFGTSRRYITFIGEQGGKSVQCHATVNEKCSTREGL